MSVEKTDTSTKSDELSENQLDMVVAGVNENLTQSPKDPNKSASESNPYGYKSIGKKFQQELKDAGLW
ncbi:MAG: hypothetical protein ACRC2R_15355 [Xenococcaceae cyanobacterium]